MTDMTTTPGKLARVSRLLLANRERGSEWWWLNDEPGRPGKKRANKFLAGAIIDYQMRAHSAWELAQRRIEDDLGDPADLWDVISAKPRYLWNARWKTRPWHRFPKGHERVWLIGKAIARDYAGDARNIWREQTPAEALGRLLKAGVGPQISRMVVGALLDAREIRGKSDVKADLHVRRVLGRVLKGRKLSEDEATTATRRMYSRNPWLLDGPLYWLGKRACSETTPQCPDCYLKAECAFKAARGR